MIFKGNKAILFFCMALFVCQPIFSQTEEDTVSLNPNTGFPEITEKPFIVFDYGLAGSMVTRIQKQTGKSNFVFEDKLVGAYFTARTENMRPADSMLRIAAYYPISSTFNRVPQVPKQTILYAFDVMYAPIFEADMWKYVRIEFAPGLHFLYQLSDSWHYMSLGLGALLGAELPVAKRWTVTLNGIATIDYPNIGSNARMFPLDYSWEYQLSLGVRYSKKKQNAYSYISSRKDLKKSDAADSEVESESAQTETEDAASNMTSE